MKKRNVFDERETSDARRQFLTRAGMATAGGLVGAGTATAVTPSAGPALTPSPAPVPVLPPAAPPVSAHTISGRLVLEAMRQEGADYDPAGSSWEGVGEAGDGSFVLYQMLGTTRSLTNTYLSSARHRPDLSAGQRKLELSSVRGEYLRGGISHILTATRGVEGDTHFIRETLVRQDQPQRALVIDPGAEYPLDGTLARWGSESASATLRLKAAPDPEMFYVCMRLEMRDNSRIAQIDREWCVKSNRRDGYPEGILVVDASGGRTRTWETKKIDRIPVLSRLPRPFLQRPIINGTTQLDGTLLQRVIAVTEPNWTPIRGQWRTEQPERMLGNQPTQSKAGLNPGERVFYREWFRNIATHAVEEIDSLPFGPMVDTLPSPFLQRPIINGTTELDGGVLQRVIAVTESGWTPIQGQWRTEQPERMLGNQGTQTKNGLTAGERVIYHEWFRNDATGKVAEVDSLPFGPMVGPRPISGLWDDAKVDRAIASLTAGSGAIFNKFVRTGDRRGYRAGTASRNLGTRVNYTPKEWWELGRTNGEWFPWLEIWGFFGHLDGSDGPASMDIRGMTLQVLYKNATEWQVLAHDKYLIGWHPQWELDVGRYPTPPDRDTSTAKIENNQQRFTTLTIPADPRPYKGYGTHFTWVDGKVEIPNCENVEGILVWCEARRTPGSNPKSRGGLHISADPKPKKEYVDNEVTYGIPWWMDIGSSQTIELSSDWQDLTTCPIGPADSNRVMPVDLLRQFHPKN